MRLYPTTKNSVPFHETCASTNSPIRVTNHSLSQGCTRSRLNWEFEFKPEHPFPIPSFLASATSSNQSLPSNTPSLYTSSSISSPSGSSTVFSPYLTLASFSPRDSGHDIFSDDGITDSALWPSFEYRGEECGPFGSPFELHMKQLPDDDHVHTQAAKERGISPGLFQSRLSSLSVQSPHAYLSFSPSSPAPSDTSSPTCAKGLTQPLSHTESRLDIYSKPTGTEQEPFLASSPVAEKSSPIIVSKKHQRSLSPLSDIESDVSPSLLNCVSLPQIKVEVESDEILAQRLARGRPIRQCRKVKSYATDDAEDVDVGDVGYTCSDIDEDLPRPRKRQCRASASTGKKAGKATRRNSTPKRGGGPHKCDFDGCKKTFTRRHDVNRHIRLVHFERDILSCQYCSASCLSRADGLRRHMQTIHPKLDPEVMDIAITKAVNTANAIFMARVKG